MRAVHPLIEAVAANGVSRDTFLRAARLDATQPLSPDARMPRAKLFELFELALELTGDPAFGLHSVEALKSEAMSPIGALVSHAATLRDALGSLQEFRALFGSESSFDIQEKDGKVRVRCQHFAEASVTARRYMCEVSLGGLYLFLRRFETSPVDYVAFAYRAPDYQAEYARVFEGRARFEQPWSGLCFDAAKLTAPAPHRDSELHDTLSAYARRRMRRLTVSQTWAERIHELLVWQSPPRDMNMRAVAKKLGVSVRSLRRHLSTEGTPYADIVSEARAAIAKVCLLDERRTIIETAQELGFADNTSFHRAFKRWTGKTPMEYRRGAVPA